MIYDTNVRQAQNAGRYKQDVALKALRPYWQYVHTSHEHPRLEHQAWDGLILSADDPWWDTHYPENGWHCRCRVDSLSRPLARREWEKSGKDGPDTAPDIEWEEKVVGKKSDHPRVVQVPKGIDPGFAYNPGKAWLDPFSPPPLTGYDEVFAQRNAPWPTGFEPPAAPSPTHYPASVLVSPQTPPVEAITDYLGHFGATLDQGVVFTDKAGSAVAITKALFVSGKDKASDNFKWLSSPDKVDRLRYINVLADTLVDPDEIWWAWEKSHDNPDKWILKRRYLKAVEIAGEGSYGISVFEWGKSGWTGATAFMTSQKTAISREKYFNKQRVGRLVYNKKQK